MLCRHEWKVVKIVKSPGMETAFEGEGIPASIFNKMVHGTTTLIIQCPKCTKFKDPVECLGTEVHEC